MLLFFFAHDFIFIFLFFPTICRSKFIFLFFMLSVDEGSNNNNLFENPHEAVTSLLSNKLVVNELMMTLNWDIEWNVWKDTFTGKDFIHFFFISHLHFVFLCVLCFVCGILVGDNFTLLFILLINPWLTSFLTSNVEKSHVNRNTVFYPQ